MKRESAGNTLKDIDAFPRPTDQRRLMGIGLPRDSRLIQAMDLVSQFGQKHDADHPMFLAGMERGEAFKKCQVVFFEDGAVRPRNDVKLGIENAF